MTSREASGREVPKSLDSTLLRHPHSVESFLKHLLSTCAQSDLKALSGHTILKIFVWTSVALMREWDNFPVCLHGWTNT